jgi:hypothetical protein
MTFRNAKIEAMQIPSCTVQIAMGKASSNHYENRSCLCYVLLIWRRKKHVKLSSRSLKAGRAVLTRSYGEVRV